MNRTLSSLALCALLATVAGCGAVRVQPQAQLPPPLIDELPVTVAVYYPAEFRDYMHKEERYQVKYEMALGAAHVTKLQRLLDAMFARVIEVGDPAGALAADPDVRMVLEPRFEDYAFLTPRDMAGDFFQVTIRYRLNVYSPQGERVDGYVFTGYGRQASSMVSSTEPLVGATERAMRDAGAKLAIDLPTQESVRRLLAGQAVVRERSVSEEVQEALGSFGTPAQPPAESSPATGAGAPNQDVGPDQRPAEAGTQPSGPAATEATRDDGAPVNPAGPASETPEAPAATGG
jgi:hypothetical protein